MIMVIQVIRRGCLKYKGIFKTFKEKKKIFGEGKCKDTKECPKKAREQHVMDDKEGYIELPACQWNKCPVCSFYHECKKNKQKTLKSCLKLNIPIYTYIQKKQK